MKVALVHDWLVSYRGGEKVLEAFMEMYPEAPIYTLFYDPKSLPESFLSKKIHYPRWLNKVGFLRKSLLPLFPFVIESFDFDDYDLVISTSSCVAKGIVVSPSCVHISYIHSPMRYVWDQKNFYLGKVLKIPVLNFFINMILSFLRIWDFTSSQRVHGLVANSSFVQKRIKQYYNRESFLVHPPVELKIKPLEKSLVEGSYFIIAGAMVSYKRFDLAILAAKKAQKKLVVAGSGPEFEGLKKLAGNDCLFFKSPDDQTLYTLIAYAEAFIFPGIEDFGIIAIEALSLGTPLIAFNKGGAKDYVEDQKNGIFFSDNSSDNSVEGLALLLKNFSKDSFDSQLIKESAKRFSKEHFKSAMNKIIFKKIEEQGV